VADAPLTELPGLLDRLGLVPVVAPRRRQPARARVLGAPRPDLGGGMKQDNSDTLWAVVGGCILYGVLLAAS
jgi:hypothetical protein